MWEVFAVQNVLHISCVVFQLEMSVFAWDSCVWYGIEMLGCILN